MRFVVALAILSSSCVFKVNRVDTTGGGGDDLGTIVMGGDDLSLGGDDLAGSTVIDMAMPAIDMAVGPDLMHPSLMLSHVPQHYLTDGTCDLTVATSIDTTNKKVDGVDPPAGCSFGSESESGLAVVVLAARSVVFNGSVTVSGNAPLVVVAGTTITVSGTVDGSATATTPGPGGAGSMAGTGAGKPGTEAGTGMNAADSGGSGGCYGTVGGNGGSGSIAGNTAAAPGKCSGYGDTLLATSVPAGSGGGNGSSEMCTGQAGGAGGGSIQLSAGSAITVAMAGLIDVGGGGGGAGCKGTGFYDQGSGAGGGSGGAIFLESPSVTVNGGLWANGGSGGGGGSGTGTAGGAGNGATRSSTTGASGGTSGGTYGGVGGGGYALMSATGDGNFGAAAGNMIANGGGGGGGAGRIVVRSRGAATITAANVSPAAQTDTSIP
ncbi:MAG TPA: hypothetical protein VGL86_25880 [Polyangia bacterium]